MRLRYSRFTRPNVLDLRFRLLLAAVRRNRVDVLRTMYAGCGERLVRHKRDIRRLLSSATECMAWLSCRYICETLGGSRHLEDPRVRVMCGVSVSQSRRRDRWIQDDDGRTLLHYAAASNSLQCLSFVPRDEWYVTDRFRSHPVAYAVQEGHCSVLDHCPSDIVDQNWLELMCSALRGGHASCVLRLLSRSDKDMLTRTIAGTPMSIAAKSAGHEIVSTLCDHWLPRQPSASHDLMQDVVCLRDRNVNDMLLASCLPRNPLRLIASDRLEELYSIHGKRFSWDASAMDDCTPTHIASAAGAMTCVREFASDSASAVSRDAAGRLPVHLAAAHHREAVMTYLYERCPGSAFVYDRHLYRLAHHCAAGDVWPYDVSIVNHNGMDANEPIALTSVALEYDSSTFLLGLMDLMATEGKCDTRSRWQVLSDACRCEAIECAYALAKRYDVVPNGPERA